MKRCKFFDKEIVALDVYKVPEERHVCRSVDRMASKDKMQSDRFIGETDCENCPFKKYEDEGNN